MHLSIYTDGASRKNPGESASGYEIFDDGGRLLAERSLYNGIKTNNEAEYIAVIEALRRALRDYGEGAEITLHSDSQLIVNQMNGKFKIKNEGLKRLNLQARSIASKFAKVRFVNVPRENEHIVSVDGGLNALLDRMGK